MHYKLSVSLGDNTNVMQTVAPDEQFNQSAAGIAVKYLSISGSESAMKSLRAGEEGISQLKKKPPKRKQYIKSKTSSTKRPKPKK